MTDPTNYEPPTGRIDTMPANGHGDLPPVDPPLPDGYDDDELDAAELDEDTVLFDGGGSGSGGGYEPPEADYARIEARQDALEAYQSAQEASRVRRKVSAATLGSAIASVIPAILASVDAMNLPADIQPFVLAGAAVLGAFLGGYTVPERPARIGTTPY